MEAQVAKSPGSMHRVHAVKRIMSMQDNMANDPILDTTKKSDNNPLPGTSDTRSSVMSDTEAEVKILEFLQSASVPVTPQHLYENLGRFHHITELQSRRAVVDLAVQHKVEVTLDGKVALAGVSENVY
jgi:hypothetical protein